MKAKDLNNKGLAGLLGVSPSTVGNWLDGKHKPEAAMISKLADLASFQWSQLFEIVYPQPNGGQADSGAKLDPLALEILQMVAGRPDAEQEAILATVKALVENFDRGSGKREPTGGAGGTATR